jgi:hypothetical protein
MTTAPGETPAVHAITRETAERLAFIRLLYREGIRQADQPEPLNAQGVLTMHDACELLLGLAADTVGASVPKNIEFMAYWSQLDPGKHPGGISLPARQRMQRVNNARNDLKHHGIRPSLATVQQVRADATVFIEDTVQALFRRPVASIDMADIVGQPDIRTKLKSATAHEANGDTRDAMADLTEAFEDLFRPYAGSPFGRAGTYGFGPTVTRGFGHPIGMNHAMTRIGSAIRINNAGDLTSAGRKIDDEMRKLTDVVAAMQRGMRVMAVGIDYPQYVRFEQLTPQVYRSPGDRQIMADQNYAPTHDEFQDCYEFVISVSLRMARLETSQPSWLAKLDLGA